MATIFDGTNGITFPDGTVQASAPVGMKNRIINGDMRIDQRNNGAAVTVGNSLVYPVDRFSSSNATLTGTITGQQSTLSGAKSFLLTATAAVTDLTAAKYVFGVRQIIEAQSCFDLNSKVISLSFKVQTNWSGKLAVGFRNNGATRSYVVDVSVTSGTNIITVPSFALEASTVSANDNSSGIEVVIGFNNAGTIQTSTTGQWLAGGFLCSTQSTNWALTTGNYINVTEVQLEQGTVATPFERRPIGTELVLCQRYYYQPSTGNNFVFGLTDTFSLPIFFPVSMRIAPNISHFITDALFVSTNPTGQQWAISAAGVAYATKTGTLLTATLTTAQQAAIYGYGITFSRNTNNLTTGTTGFITASAEL